ncbi:hypothetical protein LR48_Vigan05g017000 [Vigna angularis]|uniref:Aminotransferase-like plant mobile domain-containing protein n=1 Tax=Phaseolus angularis TaxID=3914 RepID=A0A0L9UIQ7_PHAAN|nr:hypothetical protein LR48_Vigan05g017000 [Vigna angularis]
MLEYAWQLENETPQQRTWQLQEEAFQQWTPGVELHGAWSAERCADCVSFGERDSSFTNQVSRLVDSGTRCERRSLLLWVSTKLGSRHGLTRSTTTKPLAGSRQSLGLDKALRGRSSSVVGRQSFPQWVSTKFDSRQLSAVGLDKAIRVQPRHSSPRSVSTKLSAFGLDKLFCVRPRQALLRSASTQLSAVGLDKAICVRPQQSWLFGLDNQIRRLYRQQEEKQTEAKEGVRNTTEGVFRDCSGRIPLRSGSTETFILRIVCHVDRIRMTPFMWCVNINNPVEVNLKLLKVMVSRWVGNDNSFRVSQKLVPFRVVDVLMSLGLEIGGLEIPFDEVVGGLVGEMFKSKTISLKDLTDMFNVIVDDKNIEVDVAWAVERLSLHGHPSHRFFPRIMRWFPFKSRTEKIENIFMTGDLNMEWYIRNEDRHRPEIRAAFNMDDGGMSEGSKGLRNGMSIPKLKALFTLK